MVGCLTYPFPPEAPPPGAPAPPAGAAAAAALSSATLTPWPLKLRVGENSPSLCPTICSVMYTGINFLPLWTAIVCPTISGKIVERRDHVFTTFFSFRVFNASTFSCRWLSINGPFLSERGIGFLFLHAAQFHPLRSTHFAEPTHRTRNAMRNRAEGTHKPRALGVGYLFNNHGPSRSANTQQNLG